MNNKILTISVAAYNLEKLIEDNIKSFITSDVNELIEVIVTDDGSKDGTADIVKKYVELFPNTIKLIRQKNQGAGSTVNSGIKNATGKYFKMIDGDDWVNTESLNKLVKFLSTTNVDMIITNYETYDQSKNRVIETKKFNIPKNTEMKFEDVCANLDLDMHNVTYKTEILKNNKIVLDNGFYTDVEYLILPLPFVKNVLYLDLDIYVYRIAREGQSVSLPSMQNHIDMHNLVLSRLIVYYEEQKDKLGDNARECIAKRLSNMADVELVTLLTFELDKEQIEKIKNYFEYIKSSSYDIYKKFANGKKEKLLIKSNYKLIKLESKLIKKKFFGSN